MNDYEEYENAVESYRQALRVALKPEDVETAISALGELLSVAQTIGARKARAALGIPS